MIATSELSIPRKYERDIDLLLAEEFSVASDFGTWFLSNSLNHQNTESDVVDVHVSRSDHTGESDLIVVYATRSNGARFALHIEDKIDAPLMVEQEARYRLRAESQMLRGEYQTYETVLCAPEAYLAAQPRRAGFDFCVSHERIISYFDEFQDDLRRRYRAEFIRTAKSRSLNQWVRVDDEVTNRFWDTAYEISAHEFPMLEMRRPKFTKGANWLELRPTNLRSMPTKTYLSLKGPYGFVDLTFSHTQIQYFVERLAKVLPNGVLIVQTGRASALRIESLPFDVSKEIEEGMIAFRQALAASETLISLFYEHKSLIMDAVLESRKQQVA